MDERFEGNDNYGVPKQKFLDKLKTLTDEELVEGTAHHIWLSSYAGNNPRSDFHWQCDACYDECWNRDKPELYEKAYKRAF